MNPHNMRAILKILLLAVLVQITQTSSNDSSTEVIRQPRVSGRIVKLYSGPKPEPIQCRSEGFQADPNNCVVFYRCQKSGNGKYIVFRFQCGPGTIYDPDTEICNYPQSTRRSECGGIFQTTPIHSVNEVDREQHELPSPISTKRPTHIELISTAQKDTALTSYPWQTVNEAQSSESPTVSSIYSSRHTTKKYPEPIVPSTLVTPVKNTDISCTSDGFMGDNENCRKFYRCIGNQRGGFIKYEFTCSESTIWDDDIQSCNHPWAVKRRRCGRDFSNEHISSSVVESITKNEVPPKNTVQEQTQISYGTNVTQIQTQISNGSVKQNQTQISYGDYQKVNKTIGTGIQNQTQISHNSPISQTQTQINFGDKEIQSQLQIDHGHQSSQSQIQLIESTTKISTTISNYGETDHGYNNNIQSSSESFPTNSDNICSESGFMGDSTDCKKFYRCVENGRRSYIKYEFTCGDGTVWDPNLGACNHAWAVKECGGKGKPQTSSEITSITTPPTTSKTTSHLTTSNYYSTEDYLLEENEVSYGNQNSQSTTTVSSTVGYQNFTSEALRPQTTDCHSSGFFGDENDCKTFYRCVENGRGTYTKYEYKCGEGTVWDQNIEGCNHAWAVKKCGGTAMEDINKIETTTNRELISITTVSLLQTTIQTPTQNEDYDIGYGQQQSESTIGTKLTTTTTTELPQNEHLIEGSTCLFSGFMGDKKDCKKFYRCVDSGNGSYIKYEFSCGEGTVWDQNIEACNHAWAVKDCSSGDSSFNEIDITNSSQLLSSTSSATEYYIESTSEKTTTTVTLIGSSSKPDYVICAQEGFTGDILDCKKFYRCVGNQKRGFTKYEFTCGEGTIWDSEINACNHEQSVKRPCSVSSSQSTQILDESTTETISQNVSTTIQSSTQLSPTKKPSKNICSQEGFMGDEKDCKKFYRCVNNGQGGFIKYEFMCGEGTAWDQSLQACDHSNGQCTDKVNTPRPQHEHDEIPTEGSTQIHSSSSTVENEYVTTTTKSKPTSICESEGFYGDPYNCKNFYRCVDNGKGGYTKYEFTCGEGTIWDQEIQVCNHESSNSNCFGSFNTSTTQTTGNFPENSEIYSSTSKVTTPVQQSTEKIDSSTTASSGQCSSEGFFANSKDCKKFYRCVSNGKGTYSKYDFSCGEGTIWVQEIQSCDHDTGDISCSSENENLKPSSSTQQEHIVTESPSSESFTTQSQIHDKDDPEKATQSQPTVITPGEICTSQGFYPNKNDCKKFYRCVDNGNGGYIKYEFTCGEGTAWDSNIQSCNHISEVSRCQDTNQNRPIMQDEEVLQPTEDNSSTTSQSTSRPTTQESKPSRHNNCNEEGYFGNVDNCKMFYRCVSNGKGVFTKYDYTCGEGTIWDQDITTCNHPEDVTKPSCKEGDGTSSSTSSSVEQTTSATTSPTSNTQATSESQSSSSSIDNSQFTSNCSQESLCKKPANKNVTCEKAGFYPDPNDCKKFYRCVDWDGNGRRFSVFHFDCGEGTIWDPSLETCNYEDSVYPPRDCSGSQSQTEDMGQGSTTGTTTTSQEETTTSQETTTTQKSNTQSTTEETATQSTNIDSTTQYSTTKQTTSQKPTTEQSTTNQQTTSQKSTTQQSSTSQKTTTTEQSTTTHKTTTQSTSTSEEITTELSTTTDHKTEQSTTEQTTSEPGTPTTEQSTTTEHTTTELTTTEQSTTEHTTTEQSTTEQTTTEQTTAVQTTTLGESSSTTDSNSEISTTDSSSQESTTESSTNSKCPETDNDQYLFICPTSFRRHPKYCNLFYQCTEDEDTHDVKVAVFTCPNNTIYDETKTQCVEENKADQKCNGEIAQRRKLKRFAVDSKEPIIVSREKHACPAVGHYPFEKTEECSQAFLKCKKSRNGSIRGNVFRCPEEYVYWSVSRRCELKSHLKDCKNSANDWSKRWEIPIERRNIAS